MLKCLVCLGFSLSAGGQLGGVGTVANWNPKSSLFKGTAPTEFQQLAAGESVGTVLPCMCAKLPQSCPALCDSVDYSPLDFSIHGIFQARILEWVAMASCRGSS